MQVQLLNDITLQKLFDGPNCLLIHNLRSEPAATLYLFV
jgi:hypothetical protein